MAHTHCGPVIRTQAGKRKLWSTSFEGGKNATSTQGLTAGTTQGWPPGQGHRAARTGQSCSMMLQGFRESSPKDRQGSCPNFWESSTMYSKDVFCSSRLCSQSSLELKGDLKSPSSQLHSKNFSQCVLWLVLQANNKVKSYLKPTKIRNVN